MSKFHLSINRAAGVTRGDTAKDIGLEIAAVKKEDFKIPSPSIDSVGMSRGNVKLTAPQKGVPCQAVLAGAQCDLYCQ